MRREGTKEVFKYINQEVANIHIYLPFEGEDAFEFYDIDDGAVEEIDIDRERNEVVIVYKDRTKRIYHGLPFEAVIRPIRQEDVQE